MLQTATRERHVTDSFRRNPGLQCGQRIIDNPLIGAASYKSGKVKDDKRRTGLVQHKVTPLNMLRQRRPTVTLPVAQHCR